MSRVNSFLDKNISKLMLIFLLINPIIDLLTSIFINTFSFHITIGVVIRFAVILILLYYLLFVDDSKNRKRNIIYLSILIIYILLFLVIEWGQDNLYLFIEEIKYCLKSFYFPIMLLTLYTIKDKLKKHNFLLLISMFEYIILIFVSLLFNVGYKSYQISKVGTVGFFSSANEISCIIAIICPFYIFYLFQKSNLKGKILKIIITLIYLYVISSIGTKVPLVALFITFILVFIWNFIGFIKDKKVIKITSLLFVTLMITFIGINILPKTNFYKNIKIHMNYLHIDSINDVISNPEIIDHFIFSQRVKFYQDTNQIYKKAPFIQKLFGMGYIRGENNHTKLVEMDYYDIFYSHGIVGSAIYFYVIIYILIQFFKELKEKINFNLYINLISLILIFIISLMSGHVMTSPAVSIYCAFVFILAFPRKKKELLFTAYNLNIGGIETALINLLNKIDYNRYNVTLILEKKEGNLLDKVNKNVLVSEYRVFNNKNILFRKSLNLLKRTIYTIFNYHYYDFSCCYATYSLMGEKITKISSKNNAIYIHGNYTNVYLNENDFMKFFNERGIQDFKTILFVSNESMNDFILKFSNLKKKSLVINNFVNEDRIKKLSAKKIDIEKTKEKLFVFVGRLDEQSKRISRALETIKRLKEKYSIELWLIGDGKDREDYQKFIDNNGLENNVKLLGSKKNPFPYMKKADYIFMTSEYEGFPVTYMEAIILNKKIITTINVSDQFISIPDKLGYIISKNPKKMIRQIEKILDNDHLKYEKLNVKKMEQIKMKMLENIFDEVI